MKSIYKKIKRGHITYSVKVQDLDLWIGFGTGQTTYTTIIETTQYGKGTGEGKGAVLLKGEGGVGDSAVYVTYSIKAQGVDLDDNQISKQTFERIIILYIIWPIIIMNIK